LPFSTANTVYEAAALVVLISVDDSALGDGASTLGDAVACTRKEDLRPQQLRDLWESHRKSYM
jgi:hypothetical protein